VILIDPWLKAPTNPDKESVDRLTRVDYILITHGHWDHVGDAVEIGKKTGAALVAPYGLQFAMKSVLGYPPRAAQAAAWVNPRQVVPMHFGTYPILAGTPAQFKTELDKRGYAGRMIEMKPDETRNF
jgi:L-ascorbate metabolism protein UlaG (beta-lactamase superfamily)